MVLSNDFRNFHISLKSVIFLSHLLYHIYGHYNNSTLNYYLLVVGGGMLAVSADRLTVDTDTQALASAHSDPQPSVTDGFLACNWLNSPVLL